MKKILFVDDDKKRTDIYVEMLRMEGYNVAFASTIKKAETAFRRASFDLVILDIMVPYASYIGENTLESRKCGIDFLRRIRKQNSTGDLPVILLTVCCDSKTKKEARDAGCNEYLEKPCLPSKLLETVQTLIGNENT